MDIDRFKHQHVEILDGIAKLRSFAHAGIEKNAAQIAAAVVALSSVVKLHLAIEDRILYPALQNGTSRKLAEMGRAYQEDMKGIASAYIAFRDVGVRGLSWPKDQSCFARKPTWCSRVCMPACRKRTLSSIRRSRRRRSSSHVTIYDQPDFCKIDRYGVRLARLNLSGVMMGIDPTTS